MAQVRMQEDEKQREIAEEEEQSLHSSTIPHSSQLGLNLRPCSYALETNPSPLGLLSLPWEMVARIASHLSAQCILNVLPQVCRALGQVGEDASAWQLRAHRLTGPRSSFPVCPRENFDWSTACLEMEQLIEWWVKEDEKAETAHRVEQEREVQEEMEQDRADRPNGEGAEVLVNGAAHEDVEEMRLEEEAHERPGEGEEQGNDVVLIREEGGENGAEEGGQDDSRTNSLEHITLSSGHIADINAVLLVGGEGLVCVTGSRDRNVNLWDVRSGSNGVLLNTLKARGNFSTTHRGWVWCLAASGNLLASGSFDSSVKLWDLQAGGAERMVLKSRAAVLCLSCQQHMLFAGSHDQKVSIYDTRATQPLVKSLRLHGDAVLSLASDEQYILSGSKDNTVAVYDRRAGKVLTKVQLQSYLLSMSYSGHEVWAGDNHGLLHTFSLSEGSLKPIAQFNVGHTSLVTGVHHSPGTLYTCSSDRTIKVHLPCAPPKTLCTLHYQAGLNGLSVEADVLAIASGDIDVDVWRPKH
ncbi:F-box/WD repeat-containing protein 9 [Trichomycterus rosablanca]|uniref:F-box/WD repeat-containing protein 9 n=1 Tax=Trichomycterus rosablanca TaxID=2290929 RepID=UPI002F35E953